MAELRTRVTHRLTEQALHLIVFGFVVSLSPLILVFYLLCWIRVELTSWIYSSTGHTLMSAYDTVAGIEYNSNNTVINTVTIFDDHLPVEEMKELFLKNAVNAKDSNNKLLFPKFTRCITLQAGYLMWYEKNCFDIDDHIRPFHGQPPRDEAELKSVINHLCNSPFDLSKPPWEIIVIPIEYKDTDHPQTATLYRIHHCIGDGISVLRILNEVVGNAPLKYHFNQTVNERKFRLKPTLHERLGYFKQIISTALDSPAIIYKRIFTKDQFHHYNTELSEKYRFEWISNIKMSTIKDIKNATSTTVNDVITSCFAGACRKYLLRQGVSPPNFFKSVMPIAFHHLDDPVELKNESITDLHRLPTGDMDCIQRLKSSKSIMDELKHSPGKFFTRWFLKHCGNTLPYSLMKWICDSAVYNVIFSNVPGPGTKTLFNGHLIDSGFALAQTRSPCYFGFIAVSYAGNLTVCLTVDTAIISTKEEAALVLNDFVQEVQLLYDSVIPTQSSLKDKN